MNIGFVKYHKLNYFFSIVLVLATIGCLLIFGLNLGIDFLGGTLWEVSFQDRPTNAVIQEKLNSFNLGEIVVQPTDNNGVILRLKDVDEDTHQQMISKLNEISPIQEKRFESIGPTIGKELKDKTIALAVISLASLLIYIAISFRKLKWPIASWQYGIVSIVTLLLDLTVTLLVLILLGRFYNVQFNIAIVAALLTILGYTINDKVIVFDRVRENILKDRSNNFAETIDKSLNQILGRSLSTGACTLIVLFVLFFMGGETLKYFSLTLIVGIIVGTYTSLFVASSILVSWGLKGKN
ncbi:MAG: protein translocase subunit SecF [Patescibacteria group bacterium]